MSKKTISAEKFDRLFDEGSDEIDQYLDWDSAVRVSDLPEKVDVELPKQIVAGLDREAKRRGITRQALIKMWLADRLDAAA